MVFGLADPFIALVEASCSLFHWFSFPVVCVAVAKCLVCLFLVLLWLLLKEIKVN